MRRGRSEADYEMWLARLVERTDPLMAWLGVLFALLLGFQLAVELQPSVGRALDAAVWIIWAIFVVDFGAKLLLAPAKGRFLRRHWFQLLGLLLPTLRLLSFLRLVRLGRAFPAARVLATSYRSAGTARRLLRSRLAYLTGLSVAVVVALAELGYIFENGRGGTLATFPEALFWAPASSSACRPIPSRRHGLVGWSCSPVLPPVWSSSPRWPAASVRSCWRDATNVPPAGRSGSAQNDDGGGQHQR